MEHDQYDTTTAPRSIPTSPVPSIHDPHVCRCVGYGRDRARDGGEPDVWGYFTDGEYDGSGRYFAWKANGELIGEFPSLGDATNAMILGYAP